MSDAKKTERENRPKVECECGHWYSDVIGGWPDDDLGTYVRERRCRGCMARYETAEILRSKLKPQHLGGST